MDVKDFMVKEYVYVKSGNPVKVLPTCGGIELHICDRCPDCLGETVDGKDCIRTLLDEKEIIELEGGKNMNFTEAIQKYGKITNDGGKTIYYTNKEGTIVMKTKGAGGAFSVTLDLLTSTGWEEYKENKLILPKRLGYDEEYFYISDSTRVIDVDDDYGYDVDDTRYETFNYFTDKELAQYVADKQLIHRINLVLSITNLGNFEDIKTQSLIFDYIKTNYKEVLDRINEYESKL